LRHRRGEIPNTDATNPTERDAVEIYDRRTEGDCWGIWGVCFFTVFFGSLDLITFLSLLIVIDDPMLIAYRSGLFRGLTPSRACFDCRTSGFMSHR
jgi:hypothetical protein